MTGKSMYLTISVIGHSPSSGLPRRGLVTKDGTKITEGCRALNLDDFPLGSIFELRLLVSGHDLPPQPPPTPEVAAETLAALAAQDADADSVRRTVAIAAARATNSDERTLLELLLSGAPLAAVGSRDKSLSRVVETLSRWVPSSVKWQAVLSVLSPSIEAMQCDPEGVDYWKEQSRRKWEGARRTPPTSPKTEQEELLAAVVAALQRAGARLTGSWARGEERLDSDFDFYVPKRAWAKFVREAPTGWTSVVAGHVGWRIGRHLIDVSKLFKRQNNRVAARREALSATWDTY